MYRPDNDCPHAMGGMPCAACEGPPPPGRRCVCGTFVLDEVAARDGHDFGECAARKDFEDAAWMVYAIS
jgi:hypothetical protein